MPSLAERQRAFAGAIRDSGAAIPAGLSAPPGAVREARFAVYRNNVAVGLIEALRAAFPVVDRLVGHEFFSAMARAHALETLPSSPVLLAYGGDFPRFIARFEPARALPYLADVARLEWLWLEAYHAPDAEPLAAETLAQLRPAELPQLRFRLHSSARLARFASPALSIWRLHEGADDPGDVLIDEAPEYALIVRPRAAVSAVGLTAGAFAFVNLLQAGHALAEAAGRALAIEPALDLDQLLQLLFAAGALQSVSAPGPRLPQHEEMTA